VSVRPYRGSFEPVGVAILQRANRFHINDKWPAIGADQVVGHTANPFPRNHPPQLKGLADYLSRRWIEVGQHGRSTSARRSLRTMSSAECRFRPAIRLIVPSSPASGHKTLKLVWTYSAGTRHTGAADTFPWRQDLHHSTILTEMSNWTCIGHSI
jgi:hypothetical protein